MRRFSFLKILIMNFYQSLLYFEKRNFWSIIALSSAIFFLLSSFTIFYFLINSASTFDKNNVISESNQAAINEYENYLKNNIIKKIKINEIAPESFLVTYETDTDKEIAYKVSNNKNEPLSDTEIELLEKFSTKNFKTFGKDLKKPENISYQLTNFNDYYFNKTLPFFITGIFFFCLAALSAFMRERVIYQEREAFESI